MRKKAIAVAAVKHTPHKQALISILDFMYGTKARARFTFWFATSIVTVVAGAAIVGHCCGCAQ